MSDRFFVDTNILISNWNGTGIGGTVASNGNRINWDNGTYWTRFRVYGSQNN